jgi:hypothetical protein
MKKVDMIRLLNTDGIIEAKFKQGFTIFNVIIEVVNHEHIQYISAFELLPYNGYALNKSRTHLSIVKNIRNQITGLELWKESPAGYLRLFYPFGKVKFICHYPKRYYNPQTIYRNEAE